LRGEELRAVGSLFADARGRDDPVPRPLPPLGCAPVVQPRVGSCALKTWVVPSRKARLKAVGKKLKAAECKLGKVKGKRGKLA
jgi:hypothetical protein